MKSLAGQNDKYVSSTTYCTQIDKIILPVVFFPLQADEFLLFNTVNPNLDKIGTKKYWVKRHKHTKNELRGFAPIGIMEQWSNGMMGLKEFLTI